MSLLEALPPELFHEVTSHLHFLDKKVLSMTSKNCNARTGKLKCPNLLIWHVHLRRSPTEFHKPSFQESDLFGKLITRLQIYLGSRKRREAPNTTIEELLSPYFPKPSPQSTLLYLYVVVIRDFAREAVRAAGTEGLGVVLVTSAQFWGMIERYAAFLVGWLERTKPTEVKASLSNAP